MDRQDSERKVGRGKQLKAPKGPGHTSGVHREPAWRSAMARQKRRFAKTENGLQSRETMLGAPGSVESSDTLLSPRDAERLKGARTRVRRATMLNV